MINIDGSFGEGGGQILRTSLGLSIAAGKAVKISNIRAKRDKPGLMKQHLASVNAAAEICSAEISGNHIGSKEVVFTPGKIRAGSYIFKIGSAGSTTLVLQTILPVLLSANDYFEITIEGGTHNPFSPPYDFLNESFAGALNKIGFNLSINLIRHGFYPAGGGSIKAVIKKQGRLNKLELKDNAIRKIEAVSIIANLPVKIAESEINIISEEFKLAPDNHKVLNVMSDGPGNAVIMKITNGDVSNVFTSFGEKKIPHAKVCENLTIQVKRFLASKSCVYEHLQDQLLIPFVLAGGGTFTTVRPSLHTLTNIEVIKKFMKADIDCIKKEDDLYEIKISAKE